MRPLKTEEKLEAIYYKIYNWPRNSATYIEGLQDLKQLCKKEPSVKQMVPERILELANIS